MHSRWGSASRRGDITFHGLHDEGDAVGDAMVGSIYHEDGRLRASALAPGGVVKAAEHTCRGKYQELGSKFLPLVFETHGRMKRGVGEHSQAAGEDGGGQVARGVVHPEGSGRSAAQSGRRCTVRW